MKKKIPNQKTIDAINEARGMFVKKNGLKVLVADDDFIEHLHEHGFDTIEADELYIEYADWAKENVKGK